MEGSALLIFEKRLAEGGLRMERWFWLRESDSNLVSISRCDC
jgi:hypothetical protein